MTSSVARVTGKRRNRLDTDTDSSANDNEWLIIKSRPNDIAHHPPYRHLDEHDVISGASNVPVAYLLPPLGLATVFVASAARMI